MLSNLGSKINSWSRNLPASVFSTARPQFQKWHHFHQEQWTPIADETRKEGVMHQWAGKINLVTWNIDAGAPSPRPRMSALLRVVEATSCADIIFLQEVSKDALETLMSDPWIQQHWYTSEADFSSFGSQSFVTVTLASRSFLNTHAILLGDVWRVRLPSRFKRDALCCDIIMNKSTGRSFKIRLINVHLDSLPINPSRRPAQLALVASYLREAGHGLVAGDFNPVLPEDDGLVASNDLLDAWANLHPNDPGFTWGVYGESPFPPNRLDKVALLNLTPTGMRILPTRPLDGQSEANLTDENGEAAHFSDHFGLLCELNWSETIPASAKA